MSISKDMYSKALDILNKKSRIDSIDEDEIKSELDMLIQSVKPYNRQIAEQYVSEALLDLSFINNPNIGITSLSIGRIRNSKNYS